MGMKKDVYELGNLPDPMEGIPRPDAKKVAKAYYGQDTKPWLDASDLVLMWEDERTSTYRWRSSDVRVTINNETNEIVGIVEV